MIKKNLIVTMAGLFFLAACSSAPKLDVSTLPPHHTADGRFRNTDTIGPLLLDTMHLEEAVKNFDNTFEPLPLIRGGESLWVDSSKNTATWIGQSTFYLRLGNIGVLTDPIFSNRASPVFFAGPKRGSPPGRILDSLPPVDLVLISHDHYDHLDKRSIKSIYKKYPQVIFAVPLKMAELLEDWGIPSAQIIEKDWWEEAYFKDLKLTFVPAHHKAQRFIFDRNQNKRLWGGWIIQKKERSIWFAGDIAMGDGSYYKEIASRFAPIDFCLLPIGSYLPARLTRMHVSPRQAAQLHLLMKSKFSIAMHWATFSLTKDRMWDPPNDLNRARYELSIPEDHFRVSGMGEIILIWDNNLSDN
jgi:N-acyl-phosphatidylethanolamine-hydrolysing phospholipase D